MQRKRGRRQQVQIVPAFELHTSQRRVLADVVKVRIGVPSKHTTWIPLPSPFSFSFYLPPFPPGSVAYRRHGLWPERLEQCKSMMTH